MNNTLDYIQIDSLSNTVDSSVTHDCGINFDERYDSNNTSCWNFGGSMLVWCTKIKLRSYGKSYFPNVEYMTEGTFWN